jgi:hypothetical protein
MRIGLAWVMTVRGFIRHNGQTGGYRSFLGFTADRRRGVVTLANRSRTLATWFCHTRCGPGAEAQ